MKKTFVFAIAALWLFNGCAEQPLSTESPTLTEASPADQAPACPAPTPHRACSDTVTPTFDADGTLWIVWANDKHVYLQSSTDKGQHFSEPSRVNAEPEAVASHGEYRPKIKADRQGNLFVTWTQNLEKRHSGHIRFSRSNDGGRSFSKPVTINDDPNITGHRFDSLAVGQNGEVFIAWLDARDKDKAKAENRPFDGSAVYFTWSRDGGQSFQPNRILAPHSCECCRLGTEIDSDNLPVVLWRHVFDGGIRDHAIDKFVDWDTPGPVKRVENANWKIDACPHHGPALSIDDGAYHVVWFSGTESRPGLFYTRSINQGRDFSLPYPFGGAGAKHPHVLAKDRQVWVVWSEFDGNRNIVRHLHSGDSGESWSPAETLATTAGKADDAFLIGDDRDVYLSWQTDRGYRFVPLTQ